MSKYKQSTIIKEKIKDRFICNLVMIFIILFSGCASTSQILPIATSEKPPSDKALIVVERRSGILGSAARINVYVNSTLAGKIGTGDKLSWFQDPGLTDIQFEVFFDEKLPGKNLRVEAGQIYHYEIGIDSVGFIMNGPGIRINEETKAHGPNDSLVFFRIFDNKNLLKGYTKKILITNVKTEKTTSISLKPSNIINNIHNTDGNEEAWVTLQLPEGEYFVSTIEGFTESFLRGEWWKFKIDGTFALAHEKSAVYVGDINFSEGTVLINKDSDAAKAFLKQETNNLSYAECIIRLNQ